MFGVFLLGYEAFLWIAKGNAAEFCDEEKFCKIKILSCKQTFVKNLNKEDKEAVKKWCGIR